MINEIHQNVQNFQEGNLKYLSKNWYINTHILDELPSECSRSTYPLPTKESEVISNEIMKLIKKKLIVHSTPEYNEFISGIFIKKKKDGNKRMILNLKNFNNLVNYKYFKMESINNVLNIVRPNVYIRYVYDAFFSDMLLIKNILNLQLMTCFNLHACQMDMDLLR